MNPNFQQHSIAGYLDGTDAQFLRHDLLFEVRLAQIERINRPNEFLIDPFVRTRKQKPARVIIDLDPTDDAMKNIGSGIVQNQKDDNL